MITTDSIPKFLNGWPVTQVTVNPAGSRATVMVKRDHPYHPWVVASWYTGLGPTWAAGSYHADTLAAAQAFIDLSASNAKRP